MTVTEAPRARFSPQEIRLVFAGVMLCMMLAALDQTIVATALPSIAGRLGGLDQMSWVVTAYLLTSTAAAPIYGKLSDQFGRRPVMQVAIWVFLTGSLLCALSSSMLQLILFRGVQGAGGGGLMLLSQTIIADMVTPRERGRYQGYIASVFVTSSIAGPLLGGVLVDRLSWHWVFLINLPIGMLALVATWRLLGRLVAPRVRHRIDYPGALLIVVASSTLLLVLTWGGRTLPWGSPRLLGLLAAGLALAAVFVWRQRRAAEPLFPLRLLGNPVFRGSVLITLMTAMVMFSSLIYLPLFLQLTQGVTASDAGLLLMPMMLGQVTAATVSGRVMNLTGRYKFLPFIGMPLVAAAYGLLALQAIPGGRFETGLALAMIGFGLGLTFPVMTVSVQNAVDRPDLGTATGANSFCRSLGGSLGVALFGAVLTAMLVRALAGVVDATAVRRLLETGPAALAGLEAEARGRLVQAIGPAFHVEFFGVILLEALAALAYSRVRELPLRTEMAGDGATAAGKR